MPMALDLGDTASARSLESAEGQLSQGRLTRTLFVQFSLLLKMSPGTGKCLVPW